MFPVHVAATSDVATRIAVIEGYSDNVEQTQSTVGGPVTHHPSPFTGAETMLDLHLTYPRSDQTLRLDARGQHYEPIENYTPSDDGSVAATYQARFLTSRVDTLFVQFAGSLSKLNAARLTDGVIFRIDPAEVDQTYFLLAPDVGLIHEISRRWRYEISGGPGLSYTLHEPPIVGLDGSTVTHQGLDYVQGHVQTKLFHDLSPSNIGELLSVYQYTHAVVLLDFEGNGVRNIGPGDSHTLSIEGGLTHEFGREWKSISRLGVTFATAPKQGLNTVGVPAPLLFQEIFYTAESWLFRANVSYAFASIEPTLGQGVTLGTAAALVGTPAVSGPWHDLSFLIQGQASHVIIQRGEATTQAPFGVLEGSEADVIAASVQLRYGVTKRVGVLGGYDVRYASLVGTSIPPFFQNVVYLGLSFFLSSDPTAPALTQLLPAPTSS